MNYTIVPQLRVLITGCRDWSDRRAVKDALAGATRGRSWVTVVVGDATGADAYAEEIAAADGWHIERHEADWSKGPAGGPMRNERMVKAGADKCLAFWDGESRGTLDCIKRCVAAGIPVQIFPRKARP